MPGFAGDQHDLAVAGLGARPAAQQQVDLLVAADQRGQRRSAQCLEPARDDARTQHLPGRHRPGDALELDGAEIAALEQVADQPPRGRGDHDLSGPARACRRAARFGVSPTAVCCRASPAPIGSPTTTSPVAMPMRTCKRLA